VADREPARPELTTAKSAGIDRGRRHVVYVRRVNLRPVCLERLAG
jgi:hypothetical protein